MERRGFELSPLISSSLNSPYQYLPLSAKLFETLQQKTQRTFLCYPPPRSNESRSHQAVQTISCCWSYHKQGLRWELPFGRRDPALACAAVAVPGSSSHQHSPHLPVRHSGFCCPGLQASGPCDKLVERGSTAECRHTVQCPPFQQIQTASGLFVFPALEALSVDSLLTKALMSKARQSSLGCIYPVLENEPTTFFIPLISLQGLIVLWFQV